MNRGPDGGRTASYVDVGVGMPVGAGPGLLLDNLALGVGVGVAIGVAIGVATGAGIGGVSLTLRDEGDG